MAFWDDFSDGFMMPFNWAYDKGKKLDHFGDSLINGASSAVGGAADIIGGLGNIFSGNSNILVYCGIAIIAVIVLPKLIDKAL